MRLVEDRAGYARRHEPRAEQDAAEHPCVGCAEGAAWCTVAVAPEQCLDTALDCRSLCGTGGLAFLRGFARCSAALRGAERCSRVLAGTRVALHGVDVQTVERLVARSCEGTAAASRTALQRPTEDRATGTLRGHARL